MRRLVAALTVVLLALASSPAGAWTEAEHLRIGRRAIAELSWGQRDVSRVLEDAWRTLRRDGTLAPSLCGLARTSDADCVGLPALPMLAADHACTVDDLRATVAEAWSLEVVRIAREAMSKVDDIDFDRRDPEDAANHRLQVRREIDVELQTVDPSYIGRATDNTAHFVLTRRGESETLAAFVARVVGTGKAANATALYLYFHAIALRAAVLASEARPPDALPFVRSAFIHEAYALHFLEDAFSAGHLVGTPMDEPTRNGTHDHYCREGIVTSAWGGGPVYAAHGDAFLFEADLQRASRAVQASLVQLATAFDAEVVVDDRRDRSGLLPVGPARLSPAERIAVRDVFPRSVDVDTCLATASPSGLASGELAPLMIRVLAHTPKPSIALAATRATGGLPTSLPTFRNEFGPFVPVTLRVYAGAERLFDPVAGFGGTSLVTSLRGGMGFGYATDGLLSELQDGLTYASVLGSLGLRGTDQLRGAEWDNLAELGFGGRLRVPYAYVPGDFFVWGPMAWAGSPAGLTAMSKAIKGGFTPWGESNTLVRGDVRLTLELGREVEILGLWSRATICVEASDCTPNARLTATGWELSTPIFAARLARTFEGRLGHELWARVGLRFGHQSERPQEASSSSGAPIAGAPAGATYGAFIALDSMARFYP